MKIALVFAAALQALMLLLSPYQLHIAYGQRTFRVGVHLPLSENPTINDIVKLIRVLDQNTTLLQELIPGYRLNLTYTATSYNRSQALAATIPAFLSSNIQALVGDWLSRVNVPTAVALGMTYKLWQCSGSATSSELAIKSDFPYFFRTLPDDPQIGFAMAAFIQSMGWKSVAMLSCTDSYGQSLATNFGIAAPQFGVVPSVKQVFDAPVGDVTAQLLAIKASGLRIIMLMGQSVDALQVLPQAVKLGLTGPDYVWIGAEAMIDLFYIGADSPDVVKGGNGWMVVYPAERETQWTRRLVSAWQREYPNLGVPAYGLSYVDCVAAVGRGLARLADRFGYETVMTRNYSTSLTTFLDSFEGFTGLVEFDSVGNRRGEYFVFNLFNKTTTAVAQIDTKYNVTRLLPFTFASGASNIPSDRPRPEPPFAHWSSPLGIATGCIIALFITTTLGCCLYLTVHRKSQSVRHLSYLFLMLTSLGCISVMVSTLLRIGFPDTHNCNATTWLDISGVNLVLACSAAKAYRVYIVFDNAQLGRYKRITSRDLMIGVSVIMITQYVFVTASTVFASQVPTVITSTTTPYYTCKASGDDNVEALLTGLNLGFVGVLALVVLFLAYKTRYVSKAFGESEWLFHAMQSLTMSILCLVPFYTLDFGEQHVLANGIKLTLLLYATSSTFYALVGRVAVMVFLQQRSTYDPDAQDATVDVATLPADIQDEKSSGDGKFSSGDSVSGTRTNYQLVVSGVPSKSIIVGEHGGHISGTFPVKRGDKLFATWHKHRIHVCFRQGILIMTLIRNRQGSKTSEEPPVAINLHAKICTGDVPEHPHCLRLVRSGPSSENWLVQFGPDEYTTWLSRFNEYAAALADRNAVKEVDQLLATSAMLLNNASSSIGPSHSQSMTSGAIVVTDEAGSIPLANPSSLSAVNAAGARHNRSRQPSSSSNPAALAGRIRSHPSC